MSQPTDNLPPIHPGEILLDDLEALGISARQFAAHIQVPAKAVTSILNGTRSVSAAMALHLAAALGTTPQYWLNLQDRYDTEIAEAEIGGKLGQITALVSRL